MFRRILGDKYWIKTILVMITFSMGYAAVVYRLYTLQVRDHVRLKDMAEKQQKQTIKIMPKRGTIYDSKMRELAISLDTISLYAVPGQVKDKPEAAKVLSKITGQSRRKILQQLLKKKHFVWIARKQNPEMIKKLEEAGIDGVLYLNESKRFYPNRSLASGLLGFVGLDNQGLGGIEYQYDDYIKGEPELFLAAVDGRCRKIMAEEERFSEPARTNHLILTIDKVLQYITEVELKKAVLDSRAQSGVAVMMRPSTGEILSMASYPGFNPNDFQASRSSDRQNRAILENFEPGSTFKLVTLAAALDHGVVSPRDIFFCENGAYAYRTTVYHDTSEHGWLSVKQILQRSSNIGTIKMSERLKAKDFYQTIRAFGFGEKTGVDLPGESRGLIRPVSQWSGLSLPSLSLGQEISVTALQALSSVATIANQGIRTQPYVVSQVMAPDGRVVLENRSKTLSRVISRETARFITRAMESVVTEKGTAPQAAIPGFRVAGKTGTAQKYDREIGQYSKSKYVSSFVGFVPAENPEIALIVLVNEPRVKLFYGGYVAAPAFRIIAEKALRYLRVAPQESPESVLSLAEEKEFFLETLQRRG